MVYLVFLNMPPLLDIFFCLLLLCFVWIFMYFLLFLWIHHPSSLPMDSSIFDLLVFSSIKISLLQSILIFLLDISFFSIHE